MVRDIPDKSLIADAAKQFLDNYYRTCDAPPAAAKPAAAVKGVS